MSNINGYNSAAFDLIISPFCRLIQRAILIRFAHFVQILLQGVATALKNTYKCKNSNCIRVMQSTDKRLVLFNSELHVEQLCNYMSSYKMLQGASLCQLMLEPEIAACFGYQFYYNILYINFIRNSFWYEFHQIFILENNLIRNSY